MMVEIYVRSEVTIRWIKPYRHSTTAAKIHRPVKIIHSSSGPRSGASVPGNGRLAVPAPLMELILPYLLRRLHSNSDREQARQLDQRRQAQSKEICPRPTG